MYYYVYYCRNLNPNNTKQLWKTVKLMNKQKTSIPTLNRNGTAANEDSEKANMLNQYMAEPPLANGVTIATPSITPSLTIYAFQDFVCLCWSCRRISLTMKYKTLAIMCSTGRTSFACVTYVNFIKLHNNINILRKGFEIGHHHPSVS